MTNAAHCDGRCSALRWPMQRAALGNALRCDNRRRTLPCGKEQRKAFCPPGFRLLKLPSSACRMLPAWPLSSFRGLFQAQQKPMGETFPLLPQNSTRRIRLPSFPGSNSTREPLEGVTTRSEAAQVILHWMLKEVWHGITLPFVKRNRGRKPPLVGTGILPLIKTKPPLPAGGENSSLLFSSK